jgi:hypothetical protein
MKKTTLITAGALVLLFLFLASPVLGADTPPTPPDNNCPDGSFNLGFGCSDKEGPKSGNPEDIGRSESNSEKIELDLPVPPVFVLPEGPQKPPVPSLGGGTYTFRNKGTWQLITEEQLSGIKSGSAALTLTGLDERIPSYAVDFSNAFELRIHFLLVETLDFFGKSSYELLSKFPGVDDLKGEWLVVVGGLEALISLFLIISLIKLVGNTFSSPEERDINKKNLIRAVSLFVGLPFTLALYPLFLAIINVAIKVLIPPTSAWPGIAELGKLNVPVTLFVLFTTLIAYAGLAIRYICVFVGMIIVPIGVVFYYSGVDFLAKLGSSILLFIGGVAIVGVLNASVLFVLSKIGMELAIPLGLLLIGIMTMSACKKLFSSVLIPAYAAGRATVQTVGRMVKN